MMRDARVTPWTRTHVVAYAVIGAMSCVLAFSFGFWMGRRAEAPPARTVSFEDVVPGADLVSVLAKVERVNVATTSGDMQYPAILQKGEALPVPTREPDPPGVRAEISPSTPGGTFEADAAPPGRFTVLLGVFDRQADAKAVREHLRAKGHSSWWSLERKDGQPAYRVAVGGFPTAEAADAALADIAVATTGVAVPGISAKVEPIQ
jgi:cell division septation protein DedD